MLKSIVAKLVSHFFSQYIEEIDTNKFELQIWNGIARLENLNIAKNALTSHQMPFTVKKGTVGTINLTFPWNRLNTEPCVIDLENIFILGNIKGSVMVARDLQADKKEDRSQLEGKDLPESGVWSGVFNKIVDNIQFNIKNVHVRVEIPIDDTYVAIGCTISSLVSFTIDANFQKTILAERPALLRKMVKMEQFSLYIDTNATPVPEENFNEIMLKLIHSRQHQYILRPFSFDGLLKHANKDDFKFRNELSIDTDSLNLALDASQWRGLNELQSQYKQFNKRRQFSHCGRPNRLPRSTRSSQLWWTFAHKATFAKSSQQFINVSDALEVLRNRQQYLVLYETKLNANPEIFEGSQAQKALKDLEESLEVNTVLFLRNYATMLRRSHQQGIPLSAAEIDAIVKYAPQENETGPMVLNIAVRTFTLDVLAEDKNVITQFVTNSFEMHYRKENFDTETAIKITGISLSNNISKNYPYTLKTADGCLLVNYVSKNGLSPSLNIKMTPLTIVLDVEWFTSLFNFFRIERKTIEIDYEENETFPKSKSSTKLQIQAAIEHHVSYQMDLELQKTMIIIPYQEIEDPKTLKFTFNNLKMKTESKSNFSTEDFSTLYESYAINAKQLYLELSEDVIAHPFDIEAVVDIALVKSDLFAGSKSIVKFTPLKLTVSTFHYYLFMQMLGYILDNIVFSKNNNKQAKQTEIGPINTVKAIIPNIDLDFNYYDRNLLKVNLDSVKSKMKIDNDFQMSIKSKEICALESICKQEASKFISSDSFDFFLSTNQRLYDIKLGKSFIEAKAQCCMFLCVFFLFPEDYEQILGFENQIEFKKYKHQSKNQQNNIDPEEKMMEFKFSCNESSINIVKDVKLASLDADLMECIFTKYHYGYTCDIKGINPVLCDNNKTNIFKLTDDMKEVAMSITSSLFAMKINSCFANVELDLFMTLFDYVNSLYYLGPPIGEGNLILALDIRCNEAAGVMNRTLFKANDIIYTFKDMISNNLLTIGSFEIENVGKVEDFEMNLNSHYLLILDDKTEEELEEITKDLLSKPISIYEAHKYKFNIKKNEMLIKTKNVLLITKPEAIHSLTGLVTPFIDLFKPSKPIENPIDSQFAVHLASVSLDFDYFLITFNNFVYGQNMISLDSITSTNSIISTSSNFLNIDLDPKATKIKISQSTIMINEKIFSQLSTIIPRFLSLNFGTNNHETSEVTNYFLIVEADTQNMRFVIDEKPIALQFKLIFDKSESHTTLSLDNLNIASESNVILEQTNFIYQQITGHRRKTVDLGNLFIRISPSEIVIMQKIINSFSKINFSPPTSTRAKLPQISTNFKDVSIILVSENRGPFVFLEFKPTKFLSTEDSLHLNSKSSLSYKNRSTDNRDLIIEQLSIDFYKKGDASRLTLDDPININLPIDFIEQLYQFFKEPDMKYERKLINKMDSEIIFTSVFGERSLIKQGQSIELPISDVVNFIYKGNEHQFRVSDLYYPVCSSPKFIVYKENEIITISSPFIFENNSNNKLNLLSGDKRLIGKVDAGQSIPLPTNFNIHSSLYLLGNFSDQTKQLQFNSWHSDPVLYTIKASNQKFFYYAKPRLDSQRSIGVISFYPILLFRNEFPLDIRILINDIPTTILPGEDIEIPFSGDNEGECKFAIEVDGYTRSKYKIYSKELPVDNLEFDLVSDDQRRKLHLIALRERNKETMQVFLKIHNTCIMFNQTSCYLRIKSNNMFEEFDNEKRLFLMSNSKKVTIFIGKEESPAIDISTVGISSTVFIPVESIFIPIHFNVSSAPDPFSHSNIVDFSDELMIVNELDTLITLVPLSECDYSKYSTKVRKGSSCAIHYSNKDFTYQLIINNIGKCSYLSLSAPVRTTILLDTNEIVELEIVERGECLSAHFRYPKYLSPFLVSNYLERTPMKVYQQSIKKHFNIIPMCTSAFSFENPFGEMSIYVKIANYKPYKIDILTDSDFTIFNDQFYYQVRTCGNGHRMLLVCSSPFNMDEQSFKFAFSMRSFIISLIDRDYKELCLIALNKLQTNISAEGQNYFLEITLDSIQVDDQFSATAFPVVLSGHAHDKHCFLHLSAITNRSNMFTSFKSFTLSIQRIDVFADLCFFADMTSFFKQLEFTGTKLTEIKAPEIKEQKSAGSIISFESFMIHPILIIVTFRANTGRPFALDSNLPAQLKLIPNITTAPIELDCLFINNFQATLSYMKMKVLDEYLHSLLRKMWGIAGHSDLLFNAGGILQCFGKGLRSVFYDPVHAEVASPKEMFSIITKGGGELVFGTMGQILQGGEGFVRNVSSYVNLLNFEDEQEGSSKGVNQSAGETIQEGILSLSSGIIEGITGIVKCPYEGTKKRGFSGLVEGLAKGALGVFAKPVGGVLDFGAGVIGGVRKAISKDNIIKRTRYPRACTFARLSKYNEMEAKIQFKCQHIDTKKYYKEKLMALIDNDQIIYAIFPKIICVISPESNAIIDICQIEKTNYLRTRNNFVCFTSKSIAKETENEMMIPCRDEVEVYHIITIIRSAANIAQIFEE